MASAQVKKKEHLEAGKRKLEEFRKRKAAEKAKKNSSASQPPLASDVPHEKQPSETEHVRLTDYNGAGTSDAPQEDRVVPPVVVLAFKESDTSIKSDFSPSMDTSATRASLSVKNNDISSLVQEHSYLSDDGHKDGAPSMGSNRFNSALEDYQNREDGGDRSSTEVVYALGNDNSLEHHVSSIPEARSSSHFTYNGPDNYLSIKTENSSGKSDSTSVFPSNILPKNSFSTVLWDKLGNTGYEANDLTPSSFQDKKLSDATDRMGSKKYSSPWTSSHRYSDNSSDVQSSPNHQPTSLPAAGRRARPSFLDSIPISKGTSSSSFPFGEDINDKLDSKVYPVDGLGSSLPQQTSNSLVTSGDGVGPFSNIVDQRHDFFSQKQNEDFAALEQHIEDLTQEKFSLQRALEASRSLAESLASDNSALTDSFNQQGGVVNQLKSDLEKLEEELKAQMVVLEAVKIEYANAQLECNAADERAKLLAAEVIGLEEKTLRLRSNELKLERQLENTQAEISSYRKKISSLDKDREDLLSTIDALKEEKKVLQSKLRKASSGGKSIDLSKTSDLKKNVSTSTEDLEPTKSDSLGTDLLRGHSPGSLLSHENANLNLEGQNMAIPPDQMRMIQNINTLMAELALEKDQLMQALSAESSQNFKLSELNKELTRKLEAQTQRLELLMAQSMATDNAQPRQQNLQTVHENMRYADEGDEVVERVLGWIMKLFPGGPSRRRPGKHL